MLKRDKLEGLLRKITDDEFNAIWKSTYGYFPKGQRTVLVKDFVADQYDTELDGCIARAKSLLTPTPKTQAQSVARSSLVSTASG